MLRLITRDVLSSALMAVVRGRRTDSLVEGRESFVALRPWKEMLHGESACGLWSVGVFILGARSEIDEADAIFFFSFFFFLLVRIWFL